ncbi:acetylserotonin O-methyltransferase [Amycolatopsis roodepoortensis]|uniref:acetylserotonin O-methyltransferase n=1 Tax=Amycolatopsis roodepoortensis TaxID=700274 RepID=UPI00214CD95E|nr:acetylserotonin O-methyltransferase [Amycolatopsis roodepoortensis]UUV29038.1 acetylserotonin O-methyltransferase [Amycolatopsis roodepoortensis]
MSALLDNDEANSLLRRKIMGYIVSQAIFAVTRADVVEHLGDDALPVEVIAAKAGVDRDALTRFLRVLVAEGLFTEEPRGTFAVTGLGSLLREETPGSLRHLATLMDNEAYQAWSAAEHSLRTGEAGFDKVFGKPMFDWHGERPAEAAAFDRAQAGLVTLRMLPLHEWDWSGVGSVVDVGGGNGTLVDGLLARHPRLRGTVFDQPHVVGPTTTSGRRRAIGGDFFERVPPGGDVYVLAQILHDWDDADATRILRRVAEAMTPGSRLLILEQVVPDGAEPHPAKLLDLHMLVLLGGRERTETHWRELLGGAGFEICRVTGSSRSSLIEARVAR